VLDERNPGDKHIIHDLLNRGPSPEELDLIDYDNELDDDEEDMEEEDGVVKVIISGSCLFTNWVGLNKQLLQIPRGKHVIVDVSEALLLDHSFMENILRYKKKYIDKGGTFELVGTENFKTYSDSPTATRKRIA
jgi:MFS superfamily sulfate permease-like transporter